MNKRRLIRRITAVAAGLIGATLLSEFVVLVVIGEQPKFPRHVVGAAWGLRINEPGAHYRHKSRDVEIRFDINGQGMRADRDYAYAKPAGCRRVVCLGDSFTIGYEVSFSDCFASVLERELNARGSRTEVLDAGVSGFSNAEECLYLERELYKYEPDLVLLSFFENDLADNVRTGLFALQNGLLEERNAAYVPAGGLGDFLNRSAFFNFLSERSNAFAYVKEQATLKLKREMVADNVKDRPAADPRGGAPSAAPALDEPAYERRLAARILDRLYRWTRERGIGLVIQSIPFPTAAGSPTLVDRFPREEFDVGRPGLAFFAAKDVLEPHAKEQLLYWQHSHFHWTPASHALAGKALAALILDKKLLP